MFHLQTSRAEWIKVTSTFQHVWNFPHCLARRTVNTSPCRRRNSGRVCFNHKGTAALCCLLVWMQHIYFSVRQRWASGTFIRRGCYHTLFKKALDNSTLDLPTERHFLAVMSQSFTPLSVVLLPLSVNLMKPYQGQHDQDLSTPAGQRGRGCSRWLYTRGVANVSDGRND